MQGKRTTLWHLFSTPTQKWVLGQQARRQVPCPAKAISPLGHDSNLKCQQQTSKARVKLGSLTHYPYKARTCIH